MAVTLPPAGRGANAVARCAAMTRPPFSLDAHALTRPYLTTAHSAALDALTGWLSAAGCSVRIDAMGTLIGRYEGASPGAPALAIGSHIDSVRDGGAYDGALGVCLAAACVEALAAANVRLPFAVEVIAFGDEEGSRFPSAMHASRAFVGQFDPAALRLKDAAGVSLASARHAFGLPPASDASREPGELLAFIEPHIEQGPLLETQARALGVVTAIAGQIRRRVTLTGMAGHAGTTPMGMRRDALAAAAACVLAIERTAVGMGGDVVATVGAISVAPGAANVIPGEASFTVDVRASLDAARDVAAAAIDAAIDAIAAERGVAAHAEDVHALPATRMDPRLMRRLEAACVETGAAPLSLMSGAGHDAAILAPHVPTAMLFIRCAGGVSHNPAEHVTPEDGEAALAALLAFIAQLARDGAP